MVLQCLAWTILFYKNIDTRERLIWYCVDKCGPYLRAFLSLNLSLPDSQVLVNSVCPIAAISATIKFKAVIQVSVAVAAATVANSPLSTNCFLLPSHSDSSSPMRSFTMDMCGCPFPTTTVVTTMATATVKNAELITLLRNNKQTKDKKTYCIMQLSNIFIIRCIQKMKLEEMLS